MRILILMMFMLAGIAHAEMPATPETSIHDGWIGVLVSPGEESAVTPPVIHADQLTCAGYMEGAKAFAVENGQYAEYKTVCMPMVQWLQVQSHIARQLAAVIQQQSAMIQALSKHAKGI